MPYELAREHTVMLWEILIYLVLPVAIVAASLFWAFEYWDRKPVSFYDLNEVPPASGRNPFRRHP